MKWRIFKIHGLFGGLPICTGLLVLLATSPIQAFPDESNYCSRCHDPDPGTSISVEVVNSTETFISYNVSGSDNYGDDEGWGVFNPGGNNIANDYFEGTFNLPRDGQTYRVFWVDNKYAYMDIVADGYNAADFNDDGVVNSLDYIVLAKAWRTVPTDGNYNEICDLFDDNFIDRKDLDLFTAEWLWSAG